MPTATAAYDARAAEYIDLLGSMDVVHPADRQLVDTWASTLTGGVLDAGCGPGHWTAHLAARGLDTRGVDLVPRFIAHATAAYHGIPFRLGSIDDLQDTPASLGGILSWFSTIHHDPASIETPLREFARVVRPGGGLLVGFFTGSKVEAFDHAVTEAYRWPVADLRRRVDAAGFDVVETHTRETRDARPVGALVCVRGG